MISEEAKQLAAEVGKAITVGKDGVVAVEENLYKRMLPDSLSMDQAKAFQKHNANFYAATALAVGEAAIPFMKKNAKVELVKADFPTVGRSHWEVSVARDGEVRNVSTGEVSKVFAPLSAKLTTAGSKHNQGDLQHIRKMLSERAKAELA